MGGVEANRRSVQLASVVLESGIARLQANSRVSPGKKFGLHHDVCPPKVVRLLGKRNSYTGFRSSGFSNHLFEFKRFSPISTRGVRRASSRRYSTRFDLDQAVLLVIPNLSRFYFEGQKKMPTRPTAFATPSGKLTSTKIGLRVPGIVR